MKICIVGLGAVGGLMAHHLIEGGREVSALARGATLAAVRERGLVLRDAAATDPQRRLDRSVVLRASDRAEDLGVQDLIILAVKTTALASVPALVVFSRFCTALAGHTARCLRRRWPTRQGDRSGSRDRLRAAYVSVFAGARHRDPDLR